jgi:hypothetical protein
MDKQTGEVFKLADGEKLPPGCHLLNKPPNPKCKKCFGKGWTGRYMDTGEVVPCNCILEVVEEDEGPLPEKREDEKGVGHDGDITV